MGTRGGYDCPAGHYYDNGAAGGSMTGQAMEASSIIKLCFLSHSPASRGPLSSLGLTLCERPHGRIMLGTGFGFRSHQSVDLRISDLDGSTLPSIKGQGAN